MKYNLFFVAVLTGLWTFTSVFAGLPDTIKSIKPSIVGIGTYQATRKQQLTLSGTGFVVADGRHVVTNYHVISKILNAGQDEHYVALIGRGSQGKWLRLTKVALDAKHDLALLSFNGPALPALNINQDRSVREGEFYVFTGYPIAPILGLYPVTHQAIISAITPMVAPMASSNALTSQQIKKMRQGAYNVYQLNAIAYPGNSGSPVYHPETGEVVAIVNSVYVKEGRENLLKQSSDISYAIPSRFIKKLLQKTKE